MRLWPAWKVTLLVFLGAMGILLAIAGATSGDDEDPRKAGERIGKKYGAIVILAPVAAYIIQKTRIDSANRDARK